MKRSKKSISLIYLACAVITWLITREIVATIWAIAHLPQLVDWMISPSDIIAAVIALIGFVILLKNEKINIFTNEVITELAEVTWPKPKETVMSTGVVSVLVGICAGILFSFDMFWGLLIRIFYN